MDLKDRRFRAVWSAIILVGMVLALAGGSPVAIIIFAQATNGLLLPLVAVFLLIAMNRKDLLGRYRNGAAANLLGGAVVIVAAGLGVCKLLQVAGLLD